jgi:hypothetical protein
MVKEHLPPEDISAIWKAKKKEIKQKQPANVRYLKRTQIDGRDFYDQMLHELTQANLGDYCNWQTLPYTFREIPFAHPNDIRGIRRKWQSIMQRAAPDPMVAAARWLHFKAKNVWRGCQDDQDRWVRDEVMRIEDAQGKPYSFRGEKHFDPEEHYRKRAMKAAKLGPASPAWHRAIMEFERGPGQGLQPYVAEYLDPWESGEASPTVRRLLANRLPPRMQDWDGSLPTRREYPRPQRATGPGYDVELATGPQESDFDQEEPVVRRTPREEEAEAERVLQGRYAQWEREHEEIRRQRMNPIEVLEDRTRELQEQRLPPRMEDGDGFAPMRRVRENDFFASSSPSETDDDPGVPRDPPSPLLPRSRIYEYTSDDDESYGSDASDDTPSRASTSMTRKTAPNPPGKRR